MKNKHQISMTLKITLFVFGITLITTLIVGIFMFALNALNIITLERLAPILYILASLIASCIVGTSLAAIFGKRSFKGIDKFVSALQQIGQGNFDVEFHVDRPPALKEIAENFNRMAKELSSIETLRNDFVSNFSHEFKTPIVSIRGFAKLLENPSLSDMERKEYLDIIIDESNRLSQLATNTLLLSKLESENTYAEKKLYTLDEQLRQCILLLEWEWNKKNLKLQINLPTIEFFGNEALLQQIWINLIGNAIKFAPVNGEIAISAAKTDHEIVVSITDNGLGMSEEISKRIFDKYYQGDASRATPGNGLGLSIVKRIVELCEGIIKVDSKVGQGTTFVVILPMSKINTE